MYMQLANALDAYITEEKLAPGTQLPSEPTLAAENNLSRSTILKAFELLIDRGLVSRRRGKGTFVRSRPMERRLPELTSFSEHIHSLGLRPGSILLDYAEFAPGSSLRPGSPFPDDVGIVVIERLRTVGASPVGLQRLIVPDYIAHRIGLNERIAARPDFSFYGGLCDAGIRLAEGEEALRAINATPEESEHLGVDHGTALIEVERLSHDPSGQPIEQVRARYLGTQYLYRITLTNQSNGGSHESDPRTTHRSGGGYTPCTDSLLDGDI
ncbi:GntR family transcriptional regulator [Leucobacter insecticola]|uniref:GntR family transcriptional regulator n=1 Tax=Leucobacter insecticola TaxID=2714934 RepID=A0A6G8FMX2_9MICO|nr:GntR family transcriptional regulator [Leucobacter insecticola]